MSEYIYCSGPMFSPEELNTMASIAASLESAGYKTYLPQRDGIEVAKVMAMVNTPIISGEIFRDIMIFVQKAVFAMDVYQVVERCSATVFNMNGRPADDGSISETGISFAVGKPIVIYKNDPRTEFNGLDNPLLTGLSYNWKYVTDIAKIPTNLAEMIVKVNAAGENLYLKNPPPMVKKTMEVGKEVWEILQIIRFFEHKEKDLVAILKVLMEKLKASASFMKYLEG
ncbi:nucleoside 2-deoxyribosyltransferase [Leptospira meyeri]|uniref:Nucleoside 2-deoxyribosyltransferase-like protein n=1 Tax=Leptospira meyeri TaxID=29508 RepID=A0A4R8MS69_LEPME|nr:nucleoside 2-deoxyribosyltransferase [Leptospira meyeri]PKA26840.1 nucleoside 2-deoxyribosyltransferase [Leptospira sp. mixed culture ATI2-C-A1]EKJ87960.1 nucleoside 2-deoxyribosyltransferase [Leptospira meyeri serovar Hardjo str. Went 5]EMJ90010.1 nucleoside 2-deoxyribosyltransferase [Leptospira meyeri serovar Semaranga str. Veldrot Semarang 173]MCW7487426.1 nucleoside 2-deoxyribosyltransferase [Leptospira meyeri]PJZ80766.1 nucleoside 2-deoxyribosyltransferase [Leptospira meyeri]